MNLPSMPGRGGTPATPDRAGTREAVPSVMLATYPDYALAQRLVDYLSDNKFPVERTAIVGTDLRLVERVLGRLTIARAALAGAASGAWFGLFIGLLIGLFAETGGRRYFASTSRLEASQYAVTVHAEHADEARALLTRMTWQASGAE